MLAEGGKKAVESKWTSSYRPPKALYVAATWNNWAPSEMKWDGFKFVEEVTIGKTRWESFQILVMGRWEASFYPSVKDGCPYIEYKLMGPDAKGHGRNFSMGRHPKDAMRTGDRVSVIVECDAKGAARLVTWKRLDGTGKGRFVPQYAGQMLVKMEACILGRWQYGSKEYKVSKTKEGGLRFDGPHQGGVVSGNLFPAGNYLQADLLNENGSLAGTIRLTYWREDDQMVSNFRNLARTEWGKDIYARRSV